MLPIAQIDMWSVNEIRSTGGMTMSREKKVLRETQSHCHFVHNKSDME